MSPHIATFIVGLVVMAGFFFLGWIVHAKYSTERFRAEVEAEVLRRLQIEREKAEAQRADRDKWILAKVRKSLDKAHVPDECCAQEGAGTPFSRWLCGDDETGSAHPAPVAQIGGD